MLVYQRVLLCSERAKDYFCRSETRQRLWAILKNATDVYDGFSVAAALVRKHMPLFFIGG